MKSSCLGGVLKNLAGAVLLISLLIVSMAIPDLWMHASFDRVPRWFYRAVPLSGALIFITLFFSIRFLLRGRRY
jgi:hypothetical protein